MPPEAYRRRRRFARSPEPPRRARRRRGPLRFVIQEHHATRFHHDFRLEMAGVLRSWAVPKGISLDPAQKRLAVAVEDHPLEYLDFEGVIPEGNYGAGTVMVWDLGTYESPQGDPDEGFRRGKLTVVLHGQKVRGEFHLVRTRMGRRSGRGEETQWLLFKTKDADAVPGWSLPQPSRSATSGRTIEEIRGEASAGPIASPAAPPKVPSRLRRLGLHRPGRDPMSERVPPMLAKPVGRAFDDPGWLFEPKWDGVRAIALVRWEGPRQHVLLQSRSLKLINDRYPEVVEGLAAAGLPDVVLDGEIVALDSAGRPSFQRLQQRINLRGAEVDTVRAQVPVVYYLFDILHYNGHDLTRRPLEERRRILEAAVPAGPTLRLTEAFPGEGQAFYRVALQHGLEGIVGKRRDSPYEPGRRSGAWVKVKARRSLHAVVGGYTRGRRGRRSQFGALLLGLYDDRELLRYIGHVGGGFREEELRQVLEALRPLERPTSPFSPVPRTNQPATWTEPRLVVQVEYLEWTEEGSLRFPVFQGIAPQVDPRSCRLEEAQPRRARRRTREGPPQGARVSPAEGAATLGRLRTGKGKLPALEAELSRRRLPVEFTNLDKVYWPERGLTKGDLVAYYLAVHDAILPYLRDRPLTLRRFPEGIHGADFHQKDYPDAPPHVTIARIWAESGRGANATPVCNDLATLLWLAQLGTIEMHPWFSRITPPRRGEGRGEPPHTDFASSEEALRASVLNYPDYLVFDIDPYIFPGGQQPPAGRGERDPVYSPAGFAAATEAALLLRELLQSLGLEGFIKTSGKTGLHIYVPIARRYTFEETHAFAKTLCQYLAARHPHRLTVEWAVDRRAGRVFLDYNQNRLGATLASAYSLRPTVQATVSMPLAWEEVERGVDPLAFTCTTVPQRLQQRPDPWREMRGLRQRLEEALAATGAGGDGTRPR
ncbi:MAG: non-homologous end-joining DNA ligase [Armatimonadota bacterium]|nr:non-homologous end-joining DNA ligase [Armatimonadota bacterium]MDR7468936.1 non-homologous end-joining DNA ligase [Armatimonadota bacterium]